MGGSVPKAMATVVTLTAVGTAVGLGIALFSAWELGLATMAGYVLLLLVVLTALARIRMEAPG